MTPSIGLNLRVTGYCDQGGRKYMEDVFSVAYQQTEDEKDLEYAYFGIFDGHGGREAAVYAKEHLMDHIVRQKGFWSDDDDTVLKAIHEGFISTHHAMWRELDKWPRTASGLPSTAGTTASIAFIRRGKIYIGHVGDSAIVLGFQPGDSRDTQNSQWTGKCLTRDHKPECVEESRRIHKSGGKVVSKSGVPRVVWNRPKMGHKGPVRRSTHIDEIPFLAVARSLGDLWSYNAKLDAFVVSPEPDTYCYTIDISRNRCLILGTDGCWDVMNAQQAVEEACSVEKSNEQHMLNPSGDRQWINPSKRLVDRAINRWTSGNLRADNTSVVTVMLDPPGPPRAQVLKKQRELMASTASHTQQVTSERGSMALVTNQENPEQPQQPQQQPQEPEKPEIPGFSIISRYPNCSAKIERNLAEQSSGEVLHDFQKNPALNREPQISRLSNSARIYNKHGSDKAENDSDTESVAESLASTIPLQCNDVSSSDVEEDMENDENADTPPKLTRTKGQPLLGEMMTPKLSRELSALQLSPEQNIAGLSSSRRGGRTRSASESHNSSNSDTENETPMTNNLKRGKTLPDMKSSNIEMTEETVSVNNSNRKLMLKKNNPHFLRSKEAKVKKTGDSLNLPLNYEATSVAAGGGASPTTVMSLRPRPQLPTGAITTPTGSNRKRKSELPPPLISAENCSETPSKSPRIVTVMSSKPVMTRTRTARVLQLKK